MGNKEKYIVEVTEEDLAFLPNINFLYFHLTSIYEYNIDPNYEIVDKALNEDVLLTLKLLIYLRDKEQGLGVRKQFRDIIKYIGKKDNLNLEYFISIIPQFGRWDDLYSFFNTKWEKYVIKLFKMQIKADLTKDKPSTLCKWLKSINSSSNDTKILGCRTAKGLNLSYKEYRKMLSVLRGKLDIVEKYLSNKDYASIKYGNLTSSNLKRYRKAYIRNDNDRYSEFIKYSNLFNSKRREEDENLLYFKEKILAVINNIESNKEVLFSNRIKGNDDESIVLYLDNEDNFNLRNCLVFFAAINEAANNKREFKNCLFKNDKKFFINKNDIGKLNKEINNIKSYVTTNLEIKEFMELLLLYFIRLRLPKKISPNTIKIYTTNINMLKLRGQNICSDNEKIAFFIEECKDTWNQYGYTMPKIVIVNIKNNNLNINCNPGFVIKSYSETEFAKKIIRDKINLNLNKEILKILNMYYKDLDLNV